VAAVPQSQLSFVDRSGNAKPISLPAAGYGEFLVSPNGKQLAYDFNDGNIPLIDDHKEHDAEARSITLTALRLPGDPITPAE
jgi:hypothetical protein